MNSIVSPVGYRYQELWIEDALVSVGNVVHRHRIQVMNGYPVIDLIALNTQIASVIPQDNLATAPPPLTRGIELLIQPPVRPEAGDPYRRMQLKIPESLPETLDPDQLGITSQSLGSHRFQHSLSTLSWP